MNSSMSPRRPVLALPPDADLAQWACALFAVVLPPLMAYHTPPSMTFFNQILSVMGWGLWLSFLPWPAAGGDHASSTSASDWVRRGVLALSGVWLIYGAASLAACGLTAQLPIGLALMHSGLCITALLVFLAGWTQGNGRNLDMVVDLFLWALTLAGIVSWAIGALQAYHPQWTDGVWLAEPTMPGRAVGNLRQPNHFSTMLVWSTAAAAGLGARRRIPDWLASGLVALLIWGVVLSASRTGMLGMAFLSFWGWRGRHLPRLLRLTLLGAPLVYGFWWGAAYVTAHLAKDVTFAAEARLHDHSDISSSRFKIWANVLSLIAQHPWTGVGVGEFNVAWSFTPFPTRPVAFFDHTHNVLLQWAVELGVPMAVLLTTACLLALWPLGRAWFLDEPAAQTPEQARIVSDLQGALGACGVMVAISSLHSLLEYPLWYGHLLLPTAFAWGLGLAAAGGLSAACAPAGAALAHLPTGPFRHLARALPLAGTAIVVCALWCTWDYKAAAEIYAPSEGAPPLMDRIAHSKKMPWWGYQADYAEVTVPDDDEPSPPPALFARTLHNLVDSRLMMAYARSLAEHGEVDKARYVAERLKEFRNPAATAFFAACSAPAHADAAPLPFQCSPPEHTYTWKDVLPRP